MASELAHVQRVTRLYKQSLRHLLSWVIDRRVYRQEALLLRDRFEENRHVKDRRKMIQLLEEGEAEFQRKKHPMPYIFPNSPGGSKFERNIPPPPSVLRMLPEEEKWYKEMTDWANGKD